MFHHKKCFAFLLGLVMLSGYAAAQLPTVVTNESDEELLRRARALYYTLTDHGFTSFRCVVAPDWKQVFSTLLKRTLTPEEEQRFAPYRDIYFTVTQRQGKAEVQVSVAHRNGDPVNVNDQIIGGSVQMISGFFEMWLSLTLDPLFQVGKSDTLARVEDGYKLKEARIDGEAELILDKQLLLKTVAQKKTGVLHTNFKQTPQGLLLSDVKADMPTGETGIFDIDYDTVDGFKVPSGLKVHVTSTEQDFTMSLPFSEYRIDVKKP